MPDPSSSSAPRPAPPSDQEAAGFILRLARGLHLYGYPAHNLEETLVDVSRTLGQAAQFFTTPTSIMAAFGPIDHQRTHLLRIFPGEVNLGKLALVHRVSRDVLGGRATPLEGSQRIDGIAMAPPPYPRPVQVFGYGLASAAGCRLLGGGLHEVPAAFAIGLVIGVLAIVFKRFGVPTHVFEVTATFAASAAVSLIAASGFRISTLIATLAGILVIVPGLQLTVAMTELASRHLASGTSRLAGAFIVFIAMGFGVTLGSTIVSALYGIPRSFSPIALPAWTLFAALAAAPLGFAILLRARPRDLAWVFAASVLGYAGLQIGTRALGPDVGASIGSLTVGIFSNWFERRGKGPALVTLVPGVLLLVPGSIGYRGLASILNQNVVVGLQGIVAMFMTGIALAAGLIVASVVVPTRRGGR